MGVTLGMGHMSSHPPPFASHFLANGVGPLSVCILDTHYAEPRHAKA